MGITQKLSSELNISKATVSRALNNCRGIDPGTKEAVIKAALKYGYRRYTSADIGIVMPCVPSFFWKKSYDLLNRELKSIGAKKQAFLYSSLYDERDALSCINGAINSGISVLIVAAPSSENIRKKLEEYSGKLLIILLEEYIEVSNAFYVGDNHFKSGYVLLNSYMNVFTKSRRFAVVCGLEREVIKMRLEGVKAAISERTATAKYIEMPVSKSGAASLIARQLYEIKDEIDCVVCVDGALATVAGAVYKLKSDKTIHCIGFENQTGVSDYAKNGIIKAAMFQNLTVQAQKVAALVKNYIENAVYPNEKFNYTESEIIVFE